jgi:hypothetical protein
MTDLTSVSKESVKALGVGAYLVTVLPSLTLVLVLFGLSSSSLYPWSQEIVRDAKGNVVADGPATIIENAIKLRLGGTVALVLIVLVVAVLLRPFHIAAVQALEGYWEHRWLAFVQTLAVERHRRRRSIAVWHRGRRTRGMPPKDFDGLAKYWRRYARDERDRVAGGALLGRYPHDAEFTMPTMLGNILRRAEKSAGERYGLDTVPTYPRLYPHLSNRLDLQISNQLRLLDTSAAMFIVFAVSTLVSSPILGRPDWWRLLPLVFLAAAAVAYLGAMRAAALYAQLIQTAYDLHRFDMLTALHRQLPRTSQQELRQNQELCEFLIAGEYGDKLSVLRGLYSHPTAALPLPAPSGDKQAST